MTETAVPTPEETPCPRSSDHMHCEHWYDDEGPCCFCADDGGKIHGDHQPALDCRTCWERLDDGRTTMAQIDRLAMNRRANHAGPLR